MKHWKIAALLSLCLLLAVTAACRPMGGGGEENTAEPVEVLRGDLVVSTDGNGNLAVSNDVDLSFSSAGRVVGVYVEEGDTVTRGRMLARLDDSALELAVAQAEAALVTAQSSLEQALSSYATAEAALEDAEYDYKELKRQNIHGSRRTIAELELEAAELGLDAAELGVDAAELGLTAAEDALAEAEKALAEATITAPFAGVVGDVYADEEDYVAAGTTIVYLIDPSAMELTVDLDEIDIPDIARGQKAVITVDALPDLIIEGKVGTVRPVPILESGVVLYEVDIDFAVPEDSGIMVGMSAEADIIIVEKSDVLLLPERAIAENSRGQSVVTVIADEGLEERAVTTGASDNFYMEIVSGLEEGEMVLAGD